jgi:hypothetical protein
VTACGFSVIVPEGSPITFQGESHGRVSPSSVVGGRGRVGVVSPHTRGKEHERGIQVDRGSGRTGWKYQRVGVRRGEVEVIHRFVSVVLLVSFLAV